MPRGVRCPAMSVAPRCPLPCGVRCPAVFVALRCPLLCGVRCPAVSVTLRCMSDRLLCPRCCVRATRRLLRSTRGRTVGTERCSRAPRDYQRLNGADPMSGNAEPRSLGYTRASLSRNLSCGTSHAHQHTLREILLPWKIVDLHKIDKFCVKSEVTNSNVTLETRIFYFSYLFSIT